MSRKSKKYPNEFRSGFEYDVSKQLQPYGFSYEPWQVEIGRGITVNHCVHTEESLKNHCI